MANHELELSTVAASNTDFGGVNTGEGMAPSDVNNAMRYLAKMRADAITRHVAKGAGSYTAVRSDHNQFWRCTGLVTINLTAAATLTSGWCLWVRANGGAVTIDPNGSETIDGETTLVLADGQSCLIVCTGTVFFSLFHNGRWISTDAGATVGPTLDLYRNSASPAANDIIGRVRYQGEDSAGNTEDYAEIEAQIVTTTSGSEVGAIRLRAKVTGVMTTGMDVRGDGTTISGSLIVDGIGVSGSVVASSVAVGAGGFACDGTAVVDGNTRFGQNMTDTPGQGNTTVGSAISSLGTANFSADGPSAPLRVNVNSDGGLAAWYGGGTLEGSVTVSGTTVTYGTFFGSHWSQLADGSRPDIPRGTIVDSIAQMCAWPGEENEHLPCFKVSDTAGSRRVYGVFAWWDVEPDGFNDAFIGSLGAYMVRIQADETVQIGDFIESAGNGCGRVQADDIMRASVVAKITSTEVIEIYPDGSYLVPCALHCG